MLSLSLSLFPSLSLSLSLSLSHTHTHTHTHSHTHKHTHAQNLQTRLSRFLIRLEDSYLDNPYHNRVHATDVLQWTHMLMRRGGVLRSLQVCVCICEGRCLFCSCVCEQGVCTYVYAKSVWWLCVLCTHAGVCLCSCVCVGGGGGRHVFLVRGIPARNGMRRCISCQYTLTA